MINPSFFGFEGDGVVGWGKDGCLLASCEVFVEEEANDPQGSSSGDKQIHRKERERDKLNELKKKEIFFFFFGGKCQKTSFYKKKHQKNIFILIEKKRGKNSFILWDGGDEIGDLFQKRSKN